MKRFLVTFLTLVSQAQALQLNCAIPRGTLKNELTITALSLSADQKELVQEAFWQPTTRLMVTSIETPASGGLIISGDVEQRLAMNCAGDGCAKSFVLNVSASANGIDSDSTLVIKQTGFSERGAQPEKLEFLCTYQK